MQTPAGFELPRILTPASAARMGFTRAQVRTKLRRDEWQHLARGVVLTSAEPPRRWDWAEAGVAVGGATAALSGWDALRLDGVARTPPADLPVLVLARAGRSQQVGPTLVRRTDRPYRVELTPIEHPDVPLLPYVSTARALADTATWIRDLDVVRSLASRAVQRRRCTPDNLAEELASGPRNGSRLLRQVVAEIGAGARSVAEARVASRLRGSTLPDFELNVPVVDAAGRVGYVVDVLWRRYRAVLEIEGAEFHFSRAEWQATMRRHNVLTASGLALVHYPPATLSDAGTLWLGELELWLRRRAVELGEPYLPGSPSRVARPHTPAPWFLSASLA